MSIEPDPSQRVADVDNPEESVIMRDLDDNFLLAQARSKNTIQNAIGEHPW